ncbi:MAG TPA: hypothetical protein VFP00_01435, partial [Burkholderiales bacterium]|nr:hypothetical protein [Burkholderiales bacterium]
MTPPPSFAGKPDDAVQSTRITMDPNQTPCQDPAVEKGAELPLHESGNVVTALPFGGQKSLQFFGHDRIEQTLLGLPWLILLRRAWHRRRLCRMGPAFPFLIRQRLEQARP